MPCLICGEPKTIEAHLIPKAFVAEVKTERGEQHLILHKGDKRPRVSNTGVYDSGILCGPCDSILGGHEDYVLGLLRKLRKAQVPLGGIIGVDPIDGDRVVRFAAGIAWKYAVTMQPGRIDVGPYVGVLADVALRGRSIPASVDVAMLRIVELDGDVYFYRTPMPDRKDDANVVRFTVGSFIFFLKIDRRRNGSTLPAECWLRGRAKGAFVVSVRLSPLRVARSPLKDHVAGKSAIAHPARMRSIMVILVPLLLSGCSYIYDLRAIVINGRLAFVVDPKSKQQADCIRSIHVQTADAEVARAKPGPDDAKGLVANGVFWWKDYAVDACPNKFPILYGQPLAGRAFVYSDGDTKGVEAKPLRIGVIYQVDTSSGGSGYGGGRFRIRPNRTVENLPPIDTTQNMEVGNVS